MGGGSCIFSLKPIIHSYGMFETHKNREKTCFIKALLAGLNMSQGLVAGQVPSVDDSQVLDRKHSQAQTHRIHVWYIVYVNMWGILMVNVTIYSIHGSYGKCFQLPGILPDLSRSRENTSSLTIPNNPSGNLLHSY